MERHEKVRFKNAWKEGGGLPDFPDMGKQVSVTNILGGDGQRDEERILEDRK